MCYWLSSCSWITLKRRTRASLNWTHCPLGPSVSRNIDTFLISLTCIQRWQGIAPCQATGCFNPMERLQIPRNSQTAAFPSWAQGSWVHVCGHYLQNWTLSAALILLPFGLGSELWASAEAVVCVGRDWAVWFFPGICWRRFKVEVKSGNRNSQWHSVLISIHAQVCASRCSLAYRLFRPLLLFALP